MSLKPGRLLVERADGEPVIAVEATGDLHRSWVREMERRHPGSVRMFAPSESKAARVQWDLVDLRPMTVTARL
jgi:hypothetical protein